MSYKLVDGRYQIPLVDFGKHLQSRGWNIGEHSEFGGNTGGHAENSYHNYDEALDITWKNNKYGDYDPSGKVKWDDWTDKLGTRLAGAGPEVLHRSNDPNHGTHVHLAAKGGILSLSEAQMQDFGLMDVKPARVEAKTKAQEYEKLRDGKDVSVPEATAIADPPEYGQAKPFDIRDRDVSARGGYDPRFDNK
jgi:hypothetical protein